MVFVNAEVFKKDQQPMAFALDHREPPRSASWAAPRSRSSRKSVHPPQRQKSCKSKPPGNLPVGTVRIVEKVLGAGNHSG